VRVYYFAKACWALEDIEKRRLKVSRFSDLNDPFELMGGELRDEASRSRFGKWARRIDLRCGLLCFSPTWKNPLMWSHYGDKHKGMCLGFDVRDDMLKKVVYSTERLLHDANSASNGIPRTEEMKERLLTTKFEGWKYEDERRVIVPLKEALFDGKHHFRQFDEDLRLAQVFAGARCAETETRIYQAIERLPGRIEVIKARLAFKSFRVVKNQLGFGTLQ